MPNLECKKSKSLIISVNQVTVPYPVYPLGAAYVVGALQQAGHQSAHFDLLSQGGVAALSQYLVGQEYDFIGLSIRNIDTVDSACPENYVEATKGTVALIRSRFQLPIVIGGPAVSIMPEQLLQTLEVDYAIVGEGERSIVTFAEQLVQGKRPKGQVINSPPLLKPQICTQFQPQIAKHYLAKGGMLNVQTKRGCPYRCSYCSYPSIEGSKFRYFEPAAVAEEVQRLSQDFAARYIFFTDSVFNDPAGRYLEIAEELVRRENSTPWCAFFRPQNISRDDLRLLKRSGLVAAELGTDATSDTTLAGMNKGFTFAEVQRCHRAMVDENIATAHFVIFGGPGETMDTVSEGLRNIETLSGGVVFAFLGVRIFPGTTLYQQAIAEGVIRADDSLISPTFYYSADVERAAMEESIVKAFADDLSRVYPCHELNLRIASLHKMGFAGPSWDLLLRRGRHK